MKSKHKNIFKRISLFLSGSILIIFAILPTPDDFTIAIPIASFLAGIKLIHKAFE